MRKSNAILLAALIGALVLAVALGRASTAAEPAAGSTDFRVRGNYSLEEARGMSGFSVYYAGESVAGLPLSAVERRSDEARYVSFLYGECRATDHLGCALPLEIQTWPSCARSLELYDEDDPLAPRPEATRVRGAPAGILDEGRQLELQTGDSTVVIFGETRVLVNRAAAALRGVNNVDRPGDPLRPPAPARRGGGAFVPVDAARGEPYHRERVEPGVDCRGNLSVPTRSRAP